MNYNITYSQSLMNISGDRNTSYNTTKVANICILVIETRVVILQKVTNKCILVIETQVVI